MKIYFHFRASVKIYNIFILAARVAQLARPQRLSVAMVGAVERGTFTPTLIWQGSSVGRAWDS